VAIPPQVEPSSTHLPRQRLREMGRIHLSRDPLDGLGAQVNEIAIFLLGAGLSEVQIQGDCPRGMPTIDSGHSGSHASGEVEDRAQDLSSCSSKESGGRFP
jgi:hypothetical protein